MDIVITIPKSTKWETYLEEIKNVEEKGEVMNFKVSSFPKNCKVGDKCYIVYNGMIRGWMKVMAFEEKEFQCTTTGKTLKGKFVVRHGNFNNTTPVKMKGFQGFRYFDIDKHKVQARLESASMNIIKNGHYGKYGK